MKQMWACLVTVLENPNGRLTAILRSITTVVRIAPDPNRLSTEEIAWKRKFSIKNAAACNATPNQKMGKGARVLETPQNGDS